MNSYYLLITMLKKSMFLFKFKFSYILILQNQRTTNSKKDLRSLKHDETCLVCRIDFNFGSFRAEWRNSRRPFDDALLLSPVSRCVQQMQNVLQLLRSSKLRTEQVLGLLQRPVQQMYKMLNTKDIMLILTCHKKIK